MDTRAAVTQAAQQLREHYRCERAQWVLNQREYDTVAAAVQAGTASPDVVRFFADCVRAER
jgi:hypothetical protein